MVQNLIEKAIYLFDNKKPFVLYRKPHEDHLHLIAQHEAALHRVDDYSNSGFLIAPFDSLQSPFIIKADEIEQTKITGLGQSDFIVTAEMIEDEEAESAHLRLVNRAIDDIKNGVMDKVVVSRRISVACNRFPLYAFDFLLAQYANALCYFWYHPEVGCWMGASPELFLSKQGDELLTFSLAGTKAHQDEEEVNWGF